MCLLKTCLVSPMKTLVLMVNSGSFRIMRRQMKSIQLNSICCWIHTAVLSHFSLKQKPWRVWLSSVLVTCMKSVSFFSSLQVWNSNRLTKLLWFFFFPLVSSNISFFPLSLSNSFHSLVAYVHKKKKKNLKIGSKIWIEMQSEFRVKPCL